ncbi:MAG: response regulator [bacterium]
MHETSRRVLFFEDEAPAQLLVGDILRSAGYEVTSVARGVDVLREVRERPPDIVISDLNVPGLDGNQVISMLRRSGSFEGPIVVLSGRSRDEDKREAFEAGAQAYLCKPVNRAELLDTVARLLAAPANPAPDPRPPA